MHYYTIDISIFKKVITAIRW